MGFASCAVETLADGTTISNCSTEGIILALLIALGIVLGTLLVAAIYIYHALVWKTIATKLKHPKPWIAWIPFANSAMRLQLGKFSWKWVFLYLIPILGWIAIYILLIIAHWRIYKQRKYPGIFSLAALIPEIGGILYLIIIGYVAWKDRKKQLFD